MRNMLGSVSVVYFFSLSIQTQTADGILTSRIMKCFSR